MKCKDIPIQSYGVTKTLVKFVSRALHDFWANFLNLIFIPALILLHKLEILLGTNLNYFRLLK